MPAEQARTDLGIVDLLWQQFGSEQDVLNNLALEYLAQSTDLVHDAVTELSFEHPPEELEQRIEEIAKRIGIDRSKSFASLSASFAGDDAEMEKALSDLSITTDRPGDRLYVYLMGQPQHRFEAVSQKDWKNDRGLLREIVRSDPNVIRIVLEGIDEEGWVDRVVGAVKGVFGASDEAGEVTEEGIDYRKLARKKDLIQKALAAKDWTRAPDHAARLLGLNPFEARALAAADVRRAERVLWDAYHPYLVWYYLGAVGLIGTIGMIIFYYATQITRAKPKPASEV
jgi:hypothetical protein